jgi:hypothetical protein
LIELSEEQQRRKSPNLRYVYDLPTSKEDVVALIDELGSDENVLIALQRIKDLHNPHTVADADKKQKAEKSFDKFVLALLLVYLDMAESAWTKGKQVKDQVIKNVCFHL